MKKIISLMFALCVLINTSVSADIFGSVSGGYSNDLGLGSFFYKTEFTGGTRGNQAEHYIEYTPNSDITPVIVSGDELWGSIDMYGANEYIVANGLRSKGAINADFFSFKTGLSMGYTITNGEIVATVTDTLPAIGFRADGTAFIDNLKIKTTVHKDETSAEITFINKWCQPGFDPIYLLTDYFGKTTKTQSNCLYVIGEIKEGSISLNEDASFVVEEIFEYDGEIAIPQGKAVLLIDIAGGNAECMEFMQGIQLGDELIIKNDYVESEKNLWQEATEVCSTITPQLIKNKEIGNGFEAGVNPRTAAGITENGKIILYTLDGRKTGYSAGATLEELAERMLELGCVDAINFDGGGSTAIGAKLSDLPGFQILNRPSDGYPRKVANYIFLRDNRLPTGVPKEIKYKNLVKYIYVGANQKIDIETVYDSAEYAMEGYDVSISSDNASVSGDVITFDNPGEINVSVNIKDYTDNLIFNVYDKVDSFKVFNTENWQEVEKIILFKDENYSVQLRAVPYADENELLLENGVNWEIDDKLGTVTDSGYVSFKTDECVEGKLTVELGGLKKSIPISVISSHFYDIVDHWSEDKVNALAKKNIIAGVEDDNGFAFYPDNNMTRVEFAAVIVRYLGVDLQKYKNISLNFVDSTEIAPWAEDVVKAAVSLGIMNGISNDNGMTLFFNPNENITRAEAMTVLGRTIENTDLSGKLFADDDIIPAWAREEIYNLSDAGIINGYSDNTIRPGNNVTRAEAASMIYNAVNVN